MTSISLPILKAKDFHKSSTIISEPKKANVSVGPINGVISGGYLQVQQDTAEIHLFQDSIVSPNSDLVLLTEKGKVIGAVWEKSRSRNFHRTVPLDWNLISRGKVFNESNEVEVISPDNVINVGSPVISLLKTHDWHWGHFIIEYLPGLIFCFREKIFGDLIISSKTDPTIVEILQFLIESEGWGRKILVAPERSYIHAKKMYILPFASTVSNHSVSIGILDNVYADWAVENIEHLRENLFSSFLRSGYSRSSRERIFLSRPTKIRSAVNMPETIDLFRGYGYTIMDDSRYFNNKLLSLKDKIGLFFGIKSLSGFAGSSLCNLLFVRDAVNGLALGPSGRAGEFLTSAGFFSHSKVGFFPCSEISSDPHSGFVVPIKRLNEALLELN